MQTNELRVFRSRKLTFILTDETVYVKTNLQGFYLKPREHYWKKRLIFIRTLIEIGKIEDWDQLAEFCGTGISWESTRYMPKENDGHTTTV